MLSSTVTSAVSFTEDEKVAIHQQMERLLAHAYFSHSRRFPSFLRFVIEHTLSGQTEMLKERTLGIEVFGKDADYDTGSDPIVRVTAAEIRKRIAQYYQETAHEHELRVSLPPGSYVPQFQFPAAVSAVAGSAPAPIDIAEARAEHAGAVVYHSPGHSHGRHWKLASGFLLAVIVAATLTGFLLWRNEHHSAFHNFWDPILNSGEPVLFCIADQNQYSAIALRDAGDPTRQTILKDNLTAVVIDDLSPIVKIAGVFQSNGKQYSLRGEGATTLTDLRNGPTVFIGAFDNAWTLRILKPLRYRFFDNPEMTKFSIVDTAAPANGGRPAEWAVDRVEQMATNNYRDYAIVARFTDANTGKLAIVAAGIGRGGTIAAGEFLTDPALLRAVQGVGQNKNVELVLSTQIIGGEPGTPKVEAVYVW